MNFFLVNIYGINSHALEAVDLYDKTKDKLTGNIQSILTSVLTACAHGGLVKEAQRIFDDIPNEKRSVNIWNTLVSIEYRMIQVAFFLTGREECFISCNRDHMVQ